MGQWLQDAWKRRWPNQPPPDNDDDDEDDDGDLSPATGTSVVCKPPTGRRLANSTALMRLRRSVVADAGGWRRGPSAEQRDLRARAAKDAAAGRALADQAYRECATASRKRGGAEVIRPDILRASEGAPRERLCSSTGWRLTRSTPPLGKAASTISDACLQPLARSIQTSPALALSWRPKGIVIRR